MRLYFPRCSYRCIFYFNIIIMIYLFWVITIHRQWSLHENFYTSACVLVGCKMKGKAHKMTSRDKTKQDTLMLYNVGYCFVLELYRKGLMALHCGSVYKVSCTIHNDVHYVFECFYNNNIANAILCWGVIRSNGLFEYCCCCT